MTMKWLNRLLKSVTASHSGQAQDGVHEHGFWQSRPSQQVSQHFQDIGADEDLDRAIALALSEEEHNARKQSQLQADEDLARGLQASLDLETQSNGGLGSHRGAPASAAVPWFLPANTRQSMHGAKCAGCKREIGFQRFLSCMNGYWHPECFRCERCKIPIDDREFAVNNSKPYHKQCHKELFHPRCQVCYNFIPKNGANMIEFRSHPFWGQRYCPAHEHDNTARCCSCERLESRDVEYIALADGRKLCLECLDTSLMVTGDGQSLIQEVLGFYDNLGMTIKQQIPILLVERQALNDARAGEREGSHHGAETRGLCLSEEQTIRTVSFRKNPFTGSKNPFAGIKSESHKLTRHCEVTAVLVLYGLPRLLTGSILAHELMHAWLRLNGSFPRLPHDVEEGICQVMSHIWLVSQVGNRPSSSTFGNDPMKIASQDRLGQFFINQIEMDSSPAYGEGFRRGHKAVTKFGLPATLDHIGMTGTFPE